MPNLPILADIAKKAGDVILEMQQNVIDNKRWKVKGDDTPVTIADTEANRIVCEGLQKHFPSIPIVSEENTPEANAIALRSAERFDTDPLDNTSGYIKGLDGFSVNIGRIKDGIPIAGAIYFPAKKELYFTGDDAKAYLQQGDMPPKKIHVKKLPLRTPLLAAVGFNEQHVTHLGVRSYSATPYPGQMRTCKVASGQCDITGINKGYNGGFESWDIAGPHAVLLAAGGDIVTVDGKPLRYSDNTTKLPDHIAGANEVLLALGLCDPSKLRSANNRG